MPSGRYPVAVLSITLDPALVDVNVHPAKSDVRFRDPGLVRGLIVGAIREALYREGDRAATTGTSGMMQAFRPGFSPQPSYRPQPGPIWSAQTSPSRPLQPDFQPARQGGFSEQAQAGFDVLTMPAARAEMSVSEPAASSDATAYRLGAARAQVHENYIVAQTEDGLVIVDQHAAHERLVFEAMRKALENKRLPSQVLLIPEIIDLPEEDCDRLMVHAADLDRLGLSVERFGPGAVAVRETPAMLGEVDATAMIRDLADEIAEWNTAAGLKSRLEYVAATMACHGSVRSGRRMRAEEMNALLREMEATPGSSTCNHGRPTYIELKLSDIERLFGRS
jgi:DNA mismatch repair protein MutL